MRNAPFALRNYQHWPLKNSEALSMCIGISLMDSFSERLVELCRSSFFCAGLDYSRAVPSRASLLYLAARRSTLLVRVLRYVSLLASSHLNRAFGRSFPKDERCRSSSRSSRPLIRLLLQAPPLAHVSFEAGAEPLNLSCGSLVGYDLPVN